VRIFGLTVMKNEAQRYLPEFVEHYQFLDEHFFYDDRSSDKSPKMARQASCVVRVRSEASTAFGTNEGIFREDAWKAFETALQPEFGDWVFAVDCDQFLVSRSHRNLREVLEQEAGAAKEVGIGAVMIQIPEIWGYDDEGFPLIRTDGFWDAIKGRRFFAYQRNGRYVHDTLGVPAEPYYVTASQTWLESNDLVLLHYGYARPEDAQIKYRRYRGKMGHNKDHIESINGPRQLKIWTGPHPVAVRDRWRQLQSS
jgi:hypothetical protein